jgi:hypothetical protein
MKKLIITLIFEINAKFFAEHWRKSHKIVIIISTPGYRPRVYIDLKGTDQHFGSTDWLSDTRSSSPTTRRDLRQLKTIHKIHLLVEEIFDMPTS